MLQRRILKEAAREVKDAKTLSAYIKGMSE